MRVTGVFLACALFAWATAACGPGDGAAGPEELRRARAALTGLVDPAVDFAHRSPAWHSPFRPAEEDCAHLFRLAEGRIGDDEEPAITESATFEGDHLGESAGVVLFAYPDGDADAELRHIGRLMRSCPSATVDSAGRGDRLVASELAVRPLGDGSQARRYRGRVGGYPYEMHIVVVRSGDLLVSLVHTGVARLDPEQTGRLAESVVSAVHEPSGD
ncbi:hypothetical protein GCM10009677_51700 [Sphaerisporangium rubeum]|uniref:Sensor domain-containing protein n=1 Tax=Sphaerisporangium rubeum TaxID=321317 RepID=A0A7X0M7Y3_9ACTN|nr:hypothetical protein [Sphaerisporangium rubeum]MBB6475040.1 hypothetical protein [Sphaerisporangium rubeum]